MPWVSVQDRVNFDARTRGLVSLLLYPLIYPLSPSTLSTYNTRLINRMKSNSSVFSHPTTRPANIIVDPTSLSLVNGATIAVDGGSVVRMDVMAPKL